MAYLDGLSTLLDESSLHTHLRGQRINLLLRILGIKLRLRLDLIYARLTVPDDRRTARGTCHETHTHRRIRDTHTHTHTHEKRGDVVESNARSIRAPSEQAQVYPAAIRMTHQECIKR